MCANPNGTVVFAGRLDSGLRWNEACFLLKLVPCCSDPIFDMVCFFLICADRCLFNRGDNYADTGGVLGANIIKASDKVEEFVELNYGHNAYSCGASGSPSRLYQVCGTPNAWGLPASLDGRSSVSRSVVNPQRLRRTGPN